MIKRHYINHGSDHNFWVQNDPIRQSQTEHEHIQRDEKKIHERGQDLKIRTQNSRNSHLNKKAAASRIRKTSMTVRNKKIIVTLSVVRIKDEN